MVISFLSSSNEYPIASFVAILAIGNPVALDAKAEDLETRGFISITILFPFFGFTANCTFEPPVSTPISLRIIIDSVLISCNSLSVSVNAGATVIESPVCTPIGSIFSIEQIIMQLSFLSLTTSISYSFQPKTDSSIKTSLIGEFDNPFSNVAINSFSLLTTPPPVPPSVKEGRRIAG